MTNYKSRFEQLAEFLADTEAIPLETVVAELQGADVTVAQFIAEAKALTAEPSRAHAALQFAGDLARRSKEELMRLLEELESGPFGANASSPLPAAARTRDLSRLSDKELRERIEKLQDKHADNDGDQSAHKG
jgi:hypothetical protein